MKVSRYLHLALASAALLAVPHIAAADSGFYFGANGGGTFAEDDSFANSFEADFDAATNDLPPDAMASLTGVEFDDSDSGWKAFAGYRAAKYLAFEVGWADLGELQGDSIFSLNIPSEEVDEQGTLQTSLEVSGPFVNVVIPYPFSSSFEAFAALGVFLSETELSGQFDSESGLFGGSDEDNNRDLILGLGGRYKIGEHFAIRGEFERYTQVGGGNSPQGDIDLFSIGAEFHL